jgi:hypothetical protein
LFSIITLRLFPFSPTIEPKLPTDNFGRHNGPNQ